MCLVPVQFLKGEETTLNELRTNLGNMYSINAVEANLFRNHMRRERYFMSKS